jgi:hypothetical protein
LALHAGHSMPMADNPAPSELGGKSCDRACQHESQPAAPFHCAIMSGCVAPVAIALGSELPLSDVGTPMVVPARIAAMLNPTRKPDSPPPRV